MADYIPSTEGALFAFVNNFSTVASVNEAALGLTPAQVTALTTLQNNWFAALTAKQNADTAYKGAVGTEATVQAQLVADIRALVAAIQINPGTTDALRLKLGINVPKTTHPILTVNVAGPLMHQLDFVDSATPLSKAKPAGVLSCEIRELIVPVGTPAPVDANTMPFLANDSRTPHTVHHNGTDVGKTAYYAARWTSTTQETGPWGITVSMMIA